MSGKNRPDYTLKVGAKGEKFSTAVGVAWLNKTQKTGAEYLTIQINRGISIGEEGSSIILWKNDQDFQNQTNFSSSTDGASPPMYGGPQDSEKAMWE